MSLPMRIRGLLPVAMLMLLASCAANVAVYSAEVSMDDLKLGLTLQTCNPSSLTIDVEDTAHRVELAVSAYPSRWLGGPDCQHIAIVALPEPLRGRDVFDRSARTLVPVSPSSRPWPYDRDRFTPADYEAALAATVACLETRDPAIRAAVVDDVDWPTYEWHKERDERGNMSAPVVSECHREHLDPLGG